MLKTNEYDPYLSFTGNRSNKPDGDGDNGIRKGSDMKSTLSNWGLEEGKSVHCRWEMACKAHDENWESVNGGKQPKRALTGMCRSL